MSRIRWTALVAGLAVGLVAPTTASAQTPATGVTIYNDGRVLVRRAFSIRLPKGPSTQSVPIGPADPSSVFPLDDGVAIQRAVFDGAVDEASVLRRAVGRTLAFVGDLQRTDQGDRRDTIRATVLAVDPLRLRLPDGSVTFAAPGRPLYPAELVVTQPTLALAVESDAARDALRLGYFTSGASWQAAYTVILGSRGARVSGEAVIQSETLRLDDVELQLLAGSVSRAATTLPGFAGAPRAIAMKAQALEAADVSESRVGEFHLYSVPGRHSFLPGQTTIAALFDPATTPYERTYTIAGSLPFYGFLPRQGDEDTIPATVTYTLRRPRQTAFGDRPLPGGVARLYQADSAGRLQLVGESSLDHTPAGEDLRLYAGEAFDLRARRVQTGYVTRRDSLPRGGWRTIATADYRVTVRNATDSAATVDVLERRGGEWTVVSSSVRAEKLSSTTTRFRVAVPARGEATLTYRVRVVW